MVQKVIGLNLQWAGQFLNQSSAGAGGLGIIRGNNVGESE